MLHQTLYRMFDGGNRLLYVGISQRAARRFDEHGRDKWWWPDVERITVEHFPTRDAVKVAERNAIRAESPLHNVVHARGSVVQSNAARAERLREEADDLGEFLGLGLAHTWGLLKSGHLDEAEERLRQLRAGITGGHSCPACGRPAAYALGTDRYYHDDGEDNLPCWRLIMRAPLGRPLPTPTPRSTDARPAF